MNDEFDNAFLPAVLNVKYEKNRKRKKKKNNRPPSSIQLKLSALIPDFRNQLSH